MQCNTLRAPPSGGGWLGHRKRNPGPQLQGMFSDATLLDISDVELADIKFLEDDPVIVVQFNCQQVGGTRRSVYQLTSCWACSDVTTTSRIGRPRHYILHINSDMRHCRSTAHGTSSGM